LKDWVKKKLNVLKPNNKIIVQSLIHPTETVKNNFSITKFIENKNKKLIQIGAWLRNSYSIYELPNNKDNKLCIKKCVLKGKNMEAHFKPDDLIKQIENYYPLYKQMKNYIFENITYDSICNSCKCCFDKCNCINKNVFTTRSNNPCRDNNIQSNFYYASNKYVDGLMKYLIKLDNNKNIYFTNEGKLTYDAIDIIDKNNMCVEILEKLDNTEYDNILTENIIFLNLINASAVNTLIECVIRGTPILINKIPAVVEILGEKYPLYYNNMEHAYKLINDINCIIKASKYLTKLNKNKLSMDYFIKSITKGKIFEESKKYLINN
jgi:hypothetical protein